MSVFSGDFLGFQLGNTHSSQLNITRVSNGNRYSEDMIPDFNNSTIQVPGGDGTYYWDTFYSQKPFTIDFAFDDLREEDIRKLKQLFGFKGVQPLIFDELPYKKYMVKCNAPPILKYIGFEFEGMIIYKGEGSINLIAYYPYALSTKELNFGSGKIQEINNAGDIEVPVKIYFTINNANRNISLSLFSNGEQSGELNITNISKINNNDVYICIDNRTHLIEGLNSNFEKTNTLYNRFITSGDFFVLPINKNIISSNVNWNSIKFNYLYY